MTKFLYKIKYVLLIFFSLFISNSCNIDNNLTEISDIYENDKKNRDKYDDIVWDINNKTMVKTQNIIDILEFGEITKNKLLYKLDSINRKIVKISDNERVMINYNYIMISSNNGYYILKNKYDSTIFYFLENDLVLQKIN